MAASKAAVPIFPAPGYAYDPMNEAQFRQAVERFMQETAAYPATSSGLADHSLGDHTDVTITSLTAAQYLRAASGTGSLTQTTSGLVFRDQFQRATTDTLGNSWAEWESSTTDVIIATLSGQEIVQCQASAGANNIGAFRPAAEVGPTDDLIVQMNILLSNATVNAVLRSRADGTANTEAYQFAVDCTNGWFIYRRQSSSNSTISSSASNKPSTGEVHGVRAVMEGGALRFYSTGVLSTSPDYSGFSDLSGDFTLRTSGTDGSPLTTYDRTGFQRGAAAFTNYYDEYIVCGRNITVTGVPSGHKVQVDSRTAVASTGADVVINVDTWALPATTVKVLNASDAVVKEITPAAGVWGGDVYAFSTAGDGDWQNVTPATVGSDLAGYVDHGTLVGLTDDDHLQYLLISGTRAMTGGLTMGGDLTRVSADQNYVVDSTRKHIFKVGTTEVFRVEPTAVYVEYTLDVNTADIYVDAGYALRYSGGSNNAYIPYPAAEQSLIRSAGNFVVQIDADNSGTASTFQVRHDSSSYSGGTLLFEVNEDGSVVVGTDPGGSEILRLGGGFRANANSFFDGGTGSVNLNFVSDKSTTFSPIGDILAIWGSNTVARIRLRTTADATNKDEGDILFYTSAPGGTETLALRLDQNQNALISNGSLVVGTDPGTSELVRIGGSLVLKSAQPRIRVIRTSNTNPVDIYFVPAGTLGADNQQWNLGPRTGTNNSDWYVTCYDGSTTTPIMTWSRSGPVTIHDDLIIGADLDHDGSLVGFFGTTPAAQAAAYTVTNGSTDRALDVTGDTLAQVAAVLGTLIADLQSYGLLQ